MTNKDINREEIEIMMLDAVNGGEEEKQEKKTKTWDYFWMLDIGHILI